MKFAVALAALFVCTEAFAPAIRPSAAVSKLNQVSDDMDLPCIEECALDAYPNMPESVHPGVVTGQAMLDLLDHAKQNGKISVSIGNTLWRCGAACMLQLMCCKKNSYRSTHSPPASTMQDQATTIQRNCSLPIPGAGALSWGSFIEGETGADDASAPMVGGCFFSILQNKTDYVA
jgi:hypothetical protein